MAAETVFVVDDDEAVRAGLEALLAAHGYAVECFASAEAFLARAPDARGVLLADVRMPGMSGLDLHRELRRRGVSLPTVIVTGHGDVPMAVAAIKAGAADFIEKPFDADVILAAIRTALAADRMRPASPELAAIEQRVRQLTQREREVMDLVVAGQPNKVIAHQLGIAIRTVEIHRARIMDKTGARNLSELVRMMVRLEG